MTLLPALMFLAALGQADCARCHRAEAAAQRDTPMARALERAADCEILRQNPKLAFEHGGYSYRVARDGDRSIYTVSDGKDRITVPIGWAFGRGAAGQTYVYEWKGNWYESRVSYFDQARGLDVTLGAHGTPRNLEEATGRRMDATDAAECFGCHATNAVRNGRLEPEQLVAGVQCERCHGAAEKHLAGLKSGDAKQAAMRRLGKLSAEEMSNFCGQCHRTWEQIALEGPHDINNVRFQPYRLTNSRCYDVEDARIRCTACHDPHGHAEQAAAFYDAKCLSCHGAGRGKRCPTAGAGCVSCHMPKYEIPGSHHRFTDHWIRVVRPGAAYPG